MNKHHCEKNHLSLKKVASLFIAFSLIFTSVVSGAGNVFASDTLPYLGDGAKGANQAYEHGYRSLDLKTWSPKTDPFSESMRAMIPLQARNAAFAATQAKPNLSSETQMFSLAGDYGNAFFDSYQYTNEFSQYLFNYWQYADYYGSWHGMPTEEVPESSYVSERGVSDAWKNRKFEFGIINMPNPGYTNAAHKNGVKSIGCVFLPRTGQSHSPMLEQDAQGKFLIADKLAAMCKWYGFDGWFINQEQSIPASDVPLYKAFMKQLRDQGIYIQWYDSITQSGSVSYQNEFNANNSPYVKDSSLGQVSDSIFLNYWWDNTKMTNSAALAKSMSLNPLTTVFAGIEAGGDRWSQRYDLRNNLDANGQPMNAIASLGAEFVHEGLDEDLDGGANNNIEMRREKDDYQWMTFERERMWWTGLSKDPTKTVRDTSLANPAIGVDTGDQWDGVSAYISERSVINGNTFVTNFNSGHGLEYVQDGKVSNTHEWSNIVIQDILPTWQWWQDTTGTKLNVDFDYGTKYQKTLADKTAGKFDYQLVGAYNGGSSLVVSGKLDADNFLHLYKTNLDVNRSSKMEVTFKKTSTDKAEMMLGVIFADDPNKVVKLDIAKTTSKSKDWVTSKVNLSRYAGRKIAAYGLVFSGTSDQYQMNIGEMKYASEGNKKPKTPKDLKITKAFDTKEMTITWDIANYKDVKQYNVYAVINGKEQFMGGTYDSTFYIKSLYDAKGKVTIKLKAVGADGTESEAATATYDYPKAITNVAVIAQPTSLDVSWTAPAGVNLGTTDVVVVKEYANDTTKYKTISTYGATSISVPVPATDGARYTMKIIPKDTKRKTLSTVTYDGRMADKIATPYTGKVKGGKLAEPESKDWNKMYYTVVTAGVDGNQQTISRGSNEMPTINQSADSVKVVLEDYAGNKSVEVTVLNGISVAISPTSVKLQVSKTQQFTAQVKNATTDSNVIWSVQGATSAATTISVTGLLTVGVDETASSVQVRATSKEDSAASAATTVTVTPAIVMSPATGGSVYKGLAQQLSLANIGVPMAASDFTWSISGNGASTTISQDGLLTVGPTETAYSINVTATSKANSAVVVKGRYYPTAPLAIAKVTTGTIYKGQDVTYKVTYQGAAGVLTDYNWTVESATSGIAKSENTTITDGVLSIAADENASSLKITVAKKDNEAIIASSTVSVTNPMSISTGNTAVMQGKTAAFTAKINGVAADSTKITWSVEGAEKSTEISADGILTVAEDESAASVIVKAT